MAEFSPQFLDQFRDFQRKKRQAALARTGQYLGGGARALRTGESAAQAIAERDPFAGQTMSQREKLERQTAYAGMLDKQEQEYAAMAQKERQAVFDQIMGAYRAQLQAEVQAMQEMGASARQAAQLKLRAYDHQFKEAYSDLQDLQGGDIQTRTIMDQVQKSIGPRMKEISRGAEAQYEADIAEMQQRVPHAFDQDTGDFATNAAGQQMARDMEARKRELQGDVAAARSEMLGDQVSALVDKTNPKDAQAMAQLAAGLEQMGAVGADVEALMAANPALADAEKARQTLIEDQRQALVDITQDRARVAGQTYAGSQGVREAAARLSDTAGMWQQAQQIAFGEQAADPNATEPQQEGFMGLPVTPATESRDRIMQMMELVDQYPEHPPLQEAKRALMESEQFKQYQTDRGYKDPKIAFRLMRRELRQKLRDDRRDTLQQVREDMKSGRIHGAPRPQPSAPRKPTVPVQGAEARQAEVESGEA